MMGMTLLALPVAVVGAGLSSALGFIPTYLAYAANGGSYVGAGAAKGTPPLCSALLFPAEMLTACSGPTAPQASILLQ